MTGRIGVKSANITLSTGLFSTDPNTGGFFLSVKGNLDVNNISISEFKTVDFGIEAYMGLNLNKTQSLTTKGSISSGTFGYSSYSDGRHRLGIGFSKPGRFTMKGGLLQQNDIYNYRTEEIGL